MYNIILCRLSIIIIIKKVKHFKMMLFHHKIIKNVVNPSYIFANDELPSYMMDLQQIKYYKVQYSRLTLNIFLSWLDASWTCALCLVGVAILI